MCWLLVITQKFSIAINVVYHTGVLDCHMCWLLVITQKFSIAISVAYQMEFLIVIIQDS